MTASVKEQFLKDVAHHEMSVMHDEGVYRRVRFRRPGDSNQWFELVTWPNHLTIAGDMGTYVFKRTEDMFKFFRRDQLVINEGYWAEKVVASDRISPVKEFRVESVRQWFRDNQHERLCGLDKAGRKMVNEQVRELFDHIDDLSEEEIRRAINDIDVDGDMVFHDMWEVDFTQHTHHFLWCLHAIVWGIQQYDAAKDAKGTVS